ncbi:hypothetical protein ACWDMY_35110, partial [Streptomyces globisporus]
MNTPASPTPPPAFSAPVRLLIVDDDPLVRAGLTLILGGDQGIDIDLVVSRQGEPVEWVRSVYRGDRYRFVGRL